MTIRHGKLIQELTEKLAEKKNNKSTGIAAVLIVLLFVYLFIAEKDDDAEFQDAVNAIKDKK